jgi:hypothetical protein
MTDIGKKLLFACKDSILLCKTSLGKFDATMNQMATDIGSKSAVNTIHYAPSAVDSWRLFFQPAPRAITRAGLLSTNNL